MIKDLRLKNKYFQKIINRYSSIINRKSGGFTLIELLVVIAIIGVLTALIMANFVGIRQRARDGQRKADMRQIQQALELYRSDVGAYPTQGSFSCTGTETSLKSGRATYLQKVPCDPLDNTTDYKYESDGSTYSLFGCLENEKDGQKDVPSNPNASCSTTRYSITYQNP